MRYKIRHASAFFSRLRTMASPRDLTVNSQRCLPSPSQNYTGGVDSNYSVNSANAHPIICLSWSVIQAFDVYRPLKTQHDTTRQNIHHVLGFPFHYVRNRDLIYGTNSCTNYINDTLRVTQDAPKLYILVRTF